MMAQAATFFALVVYVSATSARTLTSTQRVQSCPGKFTARSKIALLAFVIDLELIHVRRRTLLVHLCSTLFQHVRQGCCNRPVLTHTCQTRFACECMVESRVKFLSTLRLRVIPVLQECTVPVSRIALTAQPQRRRNREVGRQVASLAPISLALSTLSHCPALHC